MKVAIYSRKSKFTGKGDSVENQVQMCKEHMNRNYPEETHEFEIFEDEGFSGSNTNRPEFQRLIKEIKDKKFNVLICYRLDRISRNVSDFSSTLELLQKYDVDFISIKEQFDTSTPMGRAMVYISSVFAQLERETIAERVRDNMLELAKSGRWLGGQTPLGFNSKKIIYVDNDFKERSMYQLTPVENELKTVKVIYEKYYELKSLRKVNQWLLENRYKTKLGADWNVRAVSDLLKSPTYVKADENVFEYLKSKGISCVGNPNNKNGILTYNKKKGQSKYRNESEWIAAIAKHDGIINPDIWLDIQNTLTDNKEKAPRLGKTHHAFLTGFARCAKCGNPLTIIHGPKDKNGNKQYYYACSMKINSKKTRCDNGNINSLDLEDAVITQLKELAKDTGKLHMELNSYKEELACVKDNNEKERIQDEINEHKKAIENLVKQLSQNSTSIAAKYIISEIESREKTLLKLKEQLAKVDNKAKDTLHLEQNLELFISYLDKFYKTVDKSTIEEKKLLVAPLIDNITWDSETGNITINLWGNNKKK